MQLSDMTKLGKNDFNAFLLLNLWLITLFSNVKGYSQISAYGSAEKNDGPKIFKAINADLIFPETFNSSNNVISTTSSPPTPPTAATLATFPAHYPQASVSDIAIPVTPVVYVTPPSQTSFTPQVHNDQAMESNRMQVKTPSDYSKQPLQEETYENIQPNESHNDNDNPQQFTSTGRAVDYRPAYQLDQFMNAAKPYRAPSPLPPSQRPYALRPTARYPVELYRGQTSQYNNAKVLPYPQSSYRQYQRPQHVLRRPIGQAEIYKLGGRGEISDRFTPGEAVASALFTKNSQKHNHHHNHGNKVAAPSNFVQSYVAPKDLYSFPPNINAKYPKPSEDSKAALASISVNSYAPPPAGPIKSVVNYPLAASASNNEGYKYNGPVNPAYLTPNENTMKKPKDEPDMKPMDSGSSGTDAEDGEDTIGVLPASAMDAGDNDNKGENMGNDMKNMDDTNSMAMPNDDDHDHAHDDHHDHAHPPTSYDTGKEYPTPPPGWMEEHPDHDHGPSFPYFSHHPEIIYDDHHHDFYHDHHHPVEPPMTTLPPPPEPLPSEQPQEPRVKKYSYFYIGRKLWYIPLYFTVWFSFYVLWLILKSIARHKVNLPNHYQARRSVRSLQNHTDKEAKEYINQLTASVLQQIENFHKKYVT